MHKRINILLLIPFVLVLISCGRETSTLLKDVDSFIQERPDSALSVLEAIPHSALKTRRQKAEYSLLYSMALEKNYIDTTDVSVIMPAVEYYTRRRDCEKKFLTHYYEGRIYENGHKTVKSLRAFTAAETCMQYTNDKYRGRLFDAESRLYDDALLYDQALEATRKANEYANNSGDKYNIEVMLVNLATSYTNCEQYALADSCLSRYKEIIGNEEQYSSIYWSSKLSLQVAKKSEADSIKATIAKYEKYVKSPSKINIAYAYYSIGEIEEAVKKVNSIEENPIDDLFTDLPYYYIKSKIENAAGRKDAAIQSLMISDSLLNLLAVNSIKNSLLNTKEIYLSEISAENYRNHIRIITISAAALIIALLLTIWTWYKKRKSLNIEKDRAQNELDFLRNLLNISNETDKSFADSRSLIEKRISTLCSFLVNPQVLNDSQSERIKSISSDRKVFLDNIGVIYAIYHTKFYKFLEEKGLSLTEIGYCCLHAIGFKSNEIGELIERKDFYNINSEIRNKLGLKSTETNLNLYLKKLYQELS